MRVRATLLGFGSLLLASCSQPSEAPADTETATPVADADTAATADPTPVMIGHDGPQMDACGSFGRVTGLDPAGDNYLSVRSAPDAAASELERLRADHGVILCDASADGLWTGIVYESDNPDTPDCGTGSPVESVQAYAGSCRSGWVATEYVTLVAG